MYYERDGKIIFFEIIFLDILFLEIISSLMVWAKIKVLRNVYKLI